MMSNTSEQGPPDVHRLAMDQLMQVLSDEVVRAEGLARDLQEARETNNKYIEAIRERDHLLQEYIESLQTMRVEMRKGRS